MLRSTLRCQSTIQEERPRLCYRDPERVRVENPGGPEIQSLAYIYVQDDKQPRGHPGSLPPCSKDYCTNQTNEPPSVLSIPSQHPGVPTLLHPRDHPNMEHGTYSLRLASSRRAWPRRHPSRCEAFSVHM